MEETWTVGAVPDDVEDVAERVTSMARLKRRHTQAIETERRLAQKTEALQSTLEALPAVAPAAASASELSSALLGGALQLGGELVSQGWPNARDWEQPGELMATAGTAWLNPHAKKKHDINGGERRRACTPVSSRLVLPPRGASN